LGFNANGSSFYSWPQYATTDFYQKTVVNGVTNIREQNGQNLSNRLGYFGNMGAFYDFNAYHSLSSSLRLRGFNSTSTGTNVVSENLDGETNSYDRFQDNFSQNWGYEWSFDYVMKFPDQKGREFSASYKIDGNVRDQEFEVNQDAPENYEVARNINDGNNRENTIQIDYTHPFGEKFKFETGFKSIIRDIDSDFRFENQAEWSSSYEVVDNRTDIFYYNQDVFAGYVSTQTNITEKLGLIAGVRYEYTGLQGRFEDATDRNFDPLSYENWLPSIILNQKFGKFNSVKLSYNRRIQRPSLGNVNPYEEIGNIRNISFGNPDLNPELSDNYELGFSTFLKGTSINISAFYNDISEVIQSVIYEDPTRNATVTTFENVGTQQNVGSNLFVSTELFKIWTVRGGLNANYFMSEGIIQGQAVSNNAWLFSGNLSSNIKLPNDWMIDAFGFARPRRQTLQGYNPSFSIFGMGIKKQLWDKRGSIGLSIIEPFQARKPFESELGDENSDFYQRNVFSIPFRSFGLNFSYKFGQLDYKARQKRSRISNDDQKSGGDEGQSF
jgi:outer membrane receptor protein involved in Fe transport